MHQEKIAWPKRISEILTAVAHKRILVKFTESLTLSKFFFYLQYKHPQNFFIKIKGGVIKIAKMNIGSVSHFSHCFGVNRQVDSTIQCIDKYRGTFFFTRNVQ